MNLKALKTNCMVSFSVYNLLMLARRSEMNLPKTVPVPFGLRHQHRTSGHRGIGLQRSCGGSSMQTQRKPGIVEKSASTCSTVSLSKSGVALVSIGPVLLLLLSSLNPVQLHNNVHLICRIIFAWHSAFQQ